MTTEAKFMGTLDYISNNVSPSLSLPSGRPTKPRFRRSVSATGAMLHMGAGIAPRL